MMEHLDLPLLCGTALHVALCHRKESIAKTLISRGASLDYNGNLLATRNPKTQARTHALPEACLYGLHDVVLYLVNEKRVDLHGTHVNSVGVLGYAARNPDDDIAMVEKLLEMGVDIDVPNHEWRSTSLSLAIRECNFSIASVFLDAGANIGSGCSVPDVDEIRTPLSDCFLTISDTTYQTCGRKREDFMRKLIAAGADVNEISDFQGAQTSMPLLYAIVRGDLQAAKVLLKAGSATCDQHVISASWSMRLAAISTTSDWFSGQRLACTRNALFSSSS